MTGRLATVARAMAWASGAAMLFASAWIGVDVLLRTFGGRSLPGSVEISGYLLAIASAWSFAHALFTKSHVRVDTLYTLMPARVRPYADLAALASLAFVVGALVLHASELTWLSFEFGSRSQLAIPLWLPQGLWTFGLAFFLLTIVALLVAVGRALAAGNVGRAAALAAVESVAQDVAAEVESARRRRG